jgi:hypothetical protein
MHTDVAGKLRINLTRWNCFSLRITTETTLEESTAKSIGIESKRRFKSLYEEYTRSGVSHTMTLRFARREGEQNQYGIRLVYEIEEPKELMLKRKVETTSPKPSEAFTQLCNLEGSFLFHCDCAFTYKRGDEGINFPLPIQIDDELFDEIRGVRFVKLEQNKILLENSLDLIEADLMMHRIKFAHEGKCSVDLPQRLLRQARRISRRT